MKKKTKNSEPYEEELVAWVEAEYERRRKERASIERQWELNLSFIAGKQYVGISSRGELVEDGKAFYWQNRGVFNHIAPILESRVAKLGKISPVMSIRAKDGGDEETTNAKLSERLLKNVFENLEIKRVVAEATAWSEACGTSFYKIYWNVKGGKSIGTRDGKTVYEGEARVEAVPPFEIYPDSLSASGMGRVKSILHARIVRADEVSAAYGKAVSGEKAEVYSAKGEKQTVEDAVTLLEYYEKPAERFPEGRMIVTAGGVLLYHGELPYRNGANGNREFPFARQISVEMCGAFFGQSVTERLIPVQRAYNAVKNRKHEFINRLSMGVMNVEDGSVDTDDLAEEGLSPGKILVYRQGSKPPEMLDTGKMPAEFTEEEKSLLNEFTVVSGISDVASSSTNATVSSGTALELLIEQDNERLTVVAERIRGAYKEIARQMLRLYKEFIVGKKEIRETDGEDKTGVWYIVGANVCDDVVIENENELLYGENRKKEMLLSLYNSGILKGEDGEISAETKERVLSLLGYGDLASDYGIGRLHTEKAKEENERIRKRELAVDGYDDHKIHIEEHIRYALSEDDVLTPKEKANFEKHIAEHKKKLREEKAQ